MTNINYESNLNNPMVNQENATMVSPQVQQPFSFNVISTDEDRALLLFVDTKKQILDNLVFNLEHYRANDWDRSSCMKKMFNEAKKIISLRAGSKTIITLGYQPTECYSNEQKVACLNQLGKEIVNGRYDKSIAESLIKEYQSRSERRNQRARMQRVVPSVVDAVKPIVAATEVVKAPVKEQKPAQYNIKQQNWEKEYNFN